MDIHTFVATLTAGAIITQNTESPLLKNAYAELQAGIVDKFGADSDICQAMVAMERRPESKSRVALLEEELSMVDSPLDSEITRLAEYLRSVLGQPSSTPNKAVTIITGRGGVSIGGDANGSTISTGSYISGDYIGGDKVLGDKIGSQINTGGGAYIGGELTINDGDFIGRDQINNGPQDARAAELSPEGNKLAVLLNDFFTLEELRDISEQLEQNWSLIQSRNSANPAHALVAALERTNQTQQLKLLIRVARPQLRNQLS